MLMRQGECKRCGQCCGADGSPEQDSPWPDNWPEAVRTWTIASLEEYCPIFKLTGHPSLGAARFGESRIGNKTYRFIWVWQHGLCKDQPQWGLETAYSEECPYLMAKQPDGTRPCALVGTEHQYIFDKMCKDAPPLIMSEENVKTWVRRHPLCSYTWV